jgi:hypothetical protein
MRTATMDIRSIFDNMFMFLLKYFMKSIPNVNEKRIFTAKKRPMPNISNLSDPIREKATTNIQKKNTYRMVGKHKDDAAMLVLIVIQCGYFVGYT